MSFKLKSFFKTSFFGSIVGFSIVIVLIFIIWEVSSNQITKNYERVLADPKEIVGFVIKKSYIKGKDIEVDYTYLGKKYNYETSIDDNNFYKYQIGDTITVVICENDPTTALLKIELNKERFKQFSIVPPSSKKAVPS